MDNFLHQRLLEALYPLTLGQLFNAQSVWHDRYEVNTDDLEEIVWRGKLQKLRGILLETGNNSRRRFFGLLFCGAGAHSLYYIRALHDRLDEGLSLSSGLQQGAPDPDGSIESSIRDVVRDIAAALTGYEIEFTNKLPYPGKMPHPDD